MSSQFSAEKRIAPLPFLLRRGNLSRANQWREAETIHLAGISRLYSSQLLAGGLDSGDSNGRLVRHKSREHHYLHDLEESIGRVLSANLEGHFDRRPRWSVQRREGGPGDRFDLRFNPGDCCLSDRPVFSNLLQFGEENEVEN